VTTELAVGRNTLVTKPEPAIPVGEEQATGVNDGAGVVVATNAKVFGFLAGDGANTMVTIGPVNVLFLPAFSTQVFEVGGGEGHQLTPRR